MSLNIINMPRNKNSPSVTCINKSGKQLSTHVEITSDDVKQLLEYKKGFMEYEIHVNESIKAIVKTVEFLGKSLDSTNKELQEHKNEVQKLKETVNILINQNNNSSSSTSLSELQQRDDRLLKQREVYKYSSDTRPGSICCPDFSYDAR